MKQFYVYNLEFPPNVPEFKIAKYNFKKIPEYDDACRSLQRLSQGSQTGKHQITAIVEIPDIQEKAFLAWGDKKTKKIADILLILTLFTGRNVFLKDWEGEGAIVQDHRVHQWGGQLICSLSGEWIYKHKGTGNIIPRIENADIQLSEYDLLDIGFEKSLNSILVLISNKGWQEEYQGGYFLFLLRQAIQRQIIETSFLLCWTIWEHLFALHNNRWLESKAIEDMKALDKISFILHKYFLISMDEGARKEAKRLVETRNRIIHFGMKKEHTEYKEMEMFIRLTEQLIALILGLNPSNIFNSTERFREFLKGGSSNKLSYIKKENKFS